MALSLLEGNGKFNREDHVTMFNSNVISCDENGIIYDDTDPIWVPFGEDNDELTRELNNEVDSKKNVLGKNNIDHTAGADTTEIDPIAIRGNDALSTILYMIFKYKLVGDKAKLQCCEITLADKQGDDKYGAFTEDAIVDLKSWGGDTTKLNSPITLNWKGNRVHGVYSLKENSFSVPVAE